MPPTSASPANDDARPDLWPASCSSVRPLPSRRHVRVGVAAGVAVPAAEVARRAEHSVEVLQRLYAKWVERSGAPGERQEAHNASAESARGPAGGRPGLWEPPAPSRCTCLIPVEAQLTPGGCEHLVRHFLTICVTKPT